MDEQPSASSPGSSMLVDASLALLSYAVPFVFALVFFSRFLFLDYEVKGAAVPLPVTNASLSRRKPPHAACTSCTAAPAAALWTASQASSAGCGAAHAPPTSRKQRLHVPAAPAAALASQTSLPYSRPWPRPWH